MRTYNLIILLIFFTTLGYAQVGINTNTPDDSSALEIKSTTGGILIPRMTLDQRDTISSPSEGLMIYQLNGTVGFYFYDGTAWIKIDGVPGTPGTDGTNGSDGASAYTVWLAAGNTGTEAEFLTSLIGQQGETGQDGINALIRTIDEPAGESCENGGLKIEVGIDSNKNGVLDSEEIDLNQTKFICNMSSIANSISHGSHTFTESDSFVVPDGVNTIFFEFLSASGGGGADLTFNACNPNNTWPSRGDGGDSGKGVKVTGMIIVESGDVLTFTVGVNGLDMPTEDVCANSLYVTKYASDGSPGSLSNLSVNNNELLNFTGGSGGTGGFMNGSGSGPQDGQSGANGFHTLGNLYSNYGVIILSSENLKSSPFVRFKY